MCVYGKKKKSVNNMKGYIMKSNIPFHFNSPDPFPEETAVKLIVYPSRNILCPFLCVYIYFKANASIL